MAEETKKTFFDTRVKPTLKYVGSIGAVITTIVYIIVVLMMIFGFSVSNFQQSLAFAIVNAVVGLVIMQFLKIQGISFAKALPENEKILKEYADSQPKKPRTHSIKYYWVTSVIKDIIIKAATTALTTAGLIYIIITGSRDYILLLLALANLLMFVCFGLLSLVNSYEFFNDKHIPFIQEKINERKEAEKQASAAKEREDTIQAEVEKRVALVKEELIKQANDRIHISGGTDILESCHCNSTTCANSEPILLDSNNSNHSILGGTVHSSGIDPICANNGVEETSYENKSTEAETKC